MGYSRFEYEKEPVHYCDSCLSLNIKSVEEINLDICGECGNADVKKATPEAWNKLYTERYGEAFLNINDEHYDDLTDLDIDYDEMNENFNL